MGALLVAHSVLELDKLVHMMCFEQRWHTVGMAAVPVASLGFGDWSAGF